MKEVEDLVTCSMDNHDQSSMCDGQVLLQPIGPSAFITILWWQGFFFASLSRHNKPMGWYAIVKCIALSTPYVRAWTVPESSATTGPGEVQKAKGKLDPDSGRAKCEATHKAAPPSHTCQVQARTSRRSQSAVITTSYVETSCPWRHARALLHLSSHTTHCFIVESFLLTRRIKCFVPTLHKFLKKTYGWSACVIEITHWYCEVESNLLWGSVNVYFGISFFNAFHGGSL